jgi:hypothetical protein
MDHCFLDSDRTKRCRKRTHAYATSGQSNHTRTTRNRTRNEAEASHAIEAHVNSAGAMKHEPRNTKKRKVNTERLISEPDKSPVAGSPTANRRRVVVTGGEVWIQVVKAVNTIAQYQNNPTEDGKQVAISEARKALRLWADFSSRSDDTELLDQDIIGAIQKKIVQIQHFVSTGVE